MSEWQKLAENCRMPSVAFANTIFYFQNFGIANLEMIFETRKFSNENFQIWD
jgi:hypothetical protein